MKSLLISHHVSPFNFIAGTDLFPKNPQLPYIQPHCIKLPFPPHSSRRIYNKPHFISIKASIKIPIK